MNPFDLLHSCRRVSAHFAAGALAVALFAGVVAAQPPSRSAAVQRVAMRKLAFLAGSWRGTATVMRPSGPPLRMTQSERVQSKLGGLVLLVEGQSTGAEGRAEFQALATISYDDGTHTYRIRAYNDGHYVDAPLTVRRNGFVWGFTAGPAHIENVMRLTRGHHWKETTTVRFGGGAAHPTVRMFLRRRH